MKEVALFTEYEDEADGAAACLIDYENEGDFREPLIVRLEKIVPQLPYERFELIYNRAELNNDANKRSIVVKHHLEITKDYEYFLSLAQRANELISRYKNK